MLQQLAPDWKTLIGGVAILSNSVGIFELGLIATKPLRNCGLSPTINKVRVVLGLAIFRACHLVDR